MISKIEHRKVPLVILCFLTILLLRKSITLERFPEFHFFFLGGLLSTILALFLLFFQTKASLHMLTISALTLFIIGLSIHNQSQNIAIIAILVLMNGFVASSRLEMKAHTPKELVLGFLLVVRIYSFVLCCLQLIWFFLLLFIWNADLGLFQGVILVFILASAFNFISFILCLVKLRLAAISSIVKDVSESIP